MRSANSKIRALQKKFQKDTKAEVNVMAMGMAVLMIIIVIALAAMFMGIFPATTGVAIQSMNVTSSNPMYTTVSAVPAQASGWFGMGGALVYIMIAATMAAFGLAIFYVRTH